MTINDAETQKQKKGVGVSPLLILHNSKAKIISIFNSKLFQQIIREPVVHFLIAGALVFAASEIVEHYNTQYRIVIPSESQERIKQNYYQQYGQFPDNVQAKVLLQNYVKEEILYREAIALDLDKDDEIVRRRLSQKFSFLQQDLESLKEPSEKNLEKFYNENQSLFTERPKVTFSQVFFSTADVKDIDALNRANVAIGKLNNSNVVRAAELGDLFQGPTDYAAADDEVIKKVFGETELSEKIFGAPKDKWVGPLKSAYGYHLVRISEKSPLKVTPFSEAKAQVKSEFLDRERNRLNDAALQKISSKYTVKLEGVK